MDLLVNVLGWTVAVAVLVAYFLATTGRVQARSYTFQWINLYGAVGLMAVSIYYHVLPNVFLNAVWALIGVVGIWSIRRQHRVDDSTPPY
jgi:predicted membrane channel-forming protein YqfA (hemolysin III family)